MGRPPGWSGGSPPSTLGSKLPTLDRPPRWWLVSFVTRGIVLMRRTLGFAVTCGRVLPNARPGVVTTVRRRSRQIRRFPRPDRPIRGRGRVVRSASFYRRCESWVSRERRPREPSGAHAAKTAASGGAAQAGLATHTLASTYSLVTVQRRSCGGIASGQLIQLLHLSFNLSFDTSAKFRMAS